MQTRRRLGWAALAAVGLAACCGPSIAATRLTLRLQNVTLPEAAQRLQAEYGWKLEVAARGAAVTRRATFDWKNAAVGTVFRQLSTAYGVVAGRGDVPGVYRFETPATTSGETQLREGVAVTLRRLRQEEVRTQVIGAAGANVERTLDVTFSIRPLDGDPDSLFGLDRLHGVDDLGNEVRPVNSGLLRRQNDSLPGGAPDEWLLRIPVEGTTPRSARLQSLEGEVVLYRSVRSTRFETPVNAKGFEPLLAGPMRVTALAAEQSGGLIKGGYAVTWPKEVEISSAAAAMPGMIAPWGRLAEGGLVAVPVSYSAIYVDESGEQSARMVFDPVKLSGPITSLVWDVTVKSEPEKRVAFRFERLPLPLAAGGVGVGAVSTASLAVNLRRGGTAAGGEVSIGLSPKTRAGWGPVRWTTTETDERGVARLEGIAPGSWRVRLRFRPRGEDGALGPEKPAKLGGGEVLTLRKGETLTLKGEIPP